MNLLKWLESLVPKTIESQIEQVIKAAESQCATAIGNAVHALKQAAADGTLESELAKSPLLPFILDGLAAKFPPVP